MSFQVLHTLPNFASNLFIINATFKDLSE